MFPLLSLLNALAGAGNNKKDASRRSCMILFAVVLRVRDIVHNLEPRSCPCPSAALCSDGVLAQGPERLWGFRLLRGFLKAACTWAWAPCSDWPCWEQGCARGTSYWKQKLNLFHLTQTWPCSPYHRFLACGAAELAKMRARASTAQVPQCQLHTQTSHMHSLQRYSYVESKTQQELSFGTSDLFWK